MYGSGALLSAIALAADPSAEPHRVALLGLFAAAAAGALVLWALGPRCSLRLTQASTAAGSLLIAAGVALAGGGTLSVLYGLLFVWTAEFAAVFFRPRAALAQVWVAAGAHALALATLPAGTRVATWIVTAGTCHVVLLVNLMVERLSARLKGIVEHSGAAVAVVSPEGTIKHLGGAVERLFGHDPAGLGGVAIFDLLHADDRAAAAEALAEAVAGDGAVSFEVRLQRPNAAPLTVEANVENALDDPAVGGIVLTMRDVSERRRLQDQLAHQAHHDPLTGLPNRALFAQQVRHALARGGTGLCAVLFADLDNFKHVNDSLGHTAGDRLLEAASHRLGLVLRAADTVARLGGDEFGVLLAGVAGPEEAMVVADRIIDALQAPFPIGESEVFVTASVGVAASPAGAGADELLRDADLAMNMAKTDGRARALLFQPAMHTHLLERVELEGDLRRAVDRGELVLHYQPLVDIETSAVVGVEALVRWNHPRRGLVPPMQFIPLAEETGMIVPIGRWILEHACEGGAQLTGHDSTRPPLHVSVNLSARQLLDPGLVGHVRSALHRSSLAPDRLVLEITESVVAGNLDVIQSALEELRALGVRIAIDDFGSGYSSLRYLKTLPVDILKIDRAFVTGLGRAAKDDALADAIVTLGHSLGLATVAEGIESAVQLHHLHRAGCDLGQGFLFAAPMPLADLHQFLARPRTVAL